MSARRSRARLSLGPGSSPSLLPPPLGDASSRANRRTSFGGGSSGDEKDGTASSSTSSSEPRKDRRAMLEEWRRNRTAGGDRPPAPPSSAPSPSRPSPSKSKLARSYMASRSPARSRRHGDEAQTEATAELPLPPQQPRPEQPPSSAPSSVDLDPAETSGLSALERYRMRKKRQQGGGGGGGGDGGQAHPPTPSRGGGDYSFGTPSRGRRPPSGSSHGSSHGDEEETTTTYPYGLGTPGRRGKSRSSLGGGAQRRVRRRTSLAPSSSDGGAPAAQQQQPPPLPPSAADQPPARKAKPPLLPPSYPTAGGSSADRSREGVEEAPRRTQPPRQQQPKDPYPSSAERPSTVELQPSQPDSADSVDSAALRSRVSAMRKQIDRLEREKMELAMSKAPLEARIRQKEDAWVRERERLCAEIEDCQASSRGANERHQQLEMRFEALEEECTRLRLEARAAQGTAGGDGSGEGGSKDSWSERLNGNKEIRELRSELRNKDDAIKSLRLEKVSLESEVFGCKQEVETLERNYDELERDYQELEASKSQNAEAEIQLRSLATEHTAMTAQLNATCADLEEVKARSEADLRAKEDEWRGRESELRFEISVLKSRAGKRGVDETAAADEKDDEEDPAILKARIEERDRRIAELEERLLSGEQLRRALHNRIQELRGNIRVYVRTRPFLPNDGGGSQSSINILPDGESLRIQGRHAGDRHAFKFDKVFAPSTGQDAVFDEVSEFVQSALDGYHVCLFSYGQTGSGKTHTMQGSGNGAMRGIIPRAVEQILSQAALMRSQRWTFDVKASFLEIYNEDLRDLLVNVNANGAPKSRESRAASAPKLSIKRNAEGRSYVDGLAAVDIDVEDEARGLSQLESVMAAAARARSVATTKMNAQSSRSHSVFMLHLRGSNEESGTVVQGMLNLCDLAGSERLDRSGAASDSRRLKETQAINKSLSCLGDVFTSLANGSKHIPFRNSKLTYLLQDCLSGDGKALMFVNLSPTVASSNESLCSLRFAQRVNQVELGKATKNVQYTGGSSGRR
ncbi:hypothetical protein ACHAWF_016758 [Thalassiosira exigua]